MKQTVHFDKYDVFRVPGDTNNTVLRTALLFADLCEQHGYPVNRDALILYTNAADIPDVPVQTLIEDARQARVNLDALPFQYGLMTEPRDADGNRKGSVINIGQAAQFFRSEPADLLNAFSKNVAIFYPVGTPHGVICWDIVSRGPGLLNLIRQRIDNSVIPIVEADGGF